MRLRPFRRLLPRGLEQRTGNGLQFATELAFTVRRGRAGRIGELKPTSFAPDVTGGAKRADGGRSVRA
jgi:hypothetical protein